MAKRICYTPAQKRAIYRWRRKNKARYRQITRDAMRRLRARRKAEAESPAV